mgnify:FL=1
MEFIVERILVPHKHSFITRRMEMVPKSNRIHSHKNYELNLIISGAGRRIVGNHISSYETGDLVLLGPDLAHCWEVNGKYKNEEAECIVTHFYENIISSDFFNIPELEGVMGLLKESGSGIVFKGPKAIMAANAIRRMENLKGLESYIGLLKVFNLLLKIDQREYLALPSSLPAHFGRDHDKINRIYEYVFQNIHQGIKLEEVASFVFMEPSSFCRYFKKKTGQTFMDYVKSVRIGIAAKLLAETDKQISQICYESGYNNLANFNHYFKLYIGKTPSEYRKAFM